ncbi:MAG TPA: flagellar biosynthesis repressor FlbT [Stellaceae bacterium]|nr:flagellar biosynthesis repressor FlbT [Stellaceae bacterium]
MALRLKLPKDRRIVINGAVLRNASDQTIWIEIQNKASILQERDVMLPEQADTPLKQAYLAIQMMHLEPGLWDGHYRAFIAASALAFSLDADPAVSDAIQAAVSEVGKGSLPAALKVLQKIIGKPGKVRASAVAS